MEGSRLMFNPNVIRPLLFFLAALLLVSNVGVASSQQLAPIPSPQVAVNLGKLGWKASLPESDASFFRNFSLERLEAVDYGGRVTFLNDDVLVAYHTVHQNQANRDFRSVRYELEVFFLRAEDGALLFTKRWETVPRKTTVDLWDTESRVIPVSRNLFLVHARGMLMLYASDLSLLQEKKLDLLLEKKLEPAGDNDLWAAQGITEGRYVLLRHGMRSQNYARYEWLAVPSLEMKYQIGSDSLRNPLGTEDAIIGGSDSGIQRLDLGERVTAICQNQVCVKPDELAMLGPNRIAFVERASVGLGVIDAERGLLWSDHIDSKYAGIYALKAAASGTKLAFHVVTAKKVSFHGEKIGRSPVLFVYGAESQIPRYVLHLDILSDYALSPDGKRLAVSPTEDVVRIYPIP
jgi:hypothetical protein